MKFKRAFKLMQSGAKIKLPSWGGYWYWDDEKKTVIMHTKEWILEKLKESFIRCLIFLMINGKLLMKKIVPN